MPACPVCAQENPEIARFCLACGAALATPAAAQREERKIVTVLFADLVGFTSRAERLDPEDVRAVLRPYWERLRAELERHGGTVEKFIGDAVMALFGAPVAHEDDPERAVRAALAIRDWVREEDGIQVRVAVATGEALVQLGAQPAEGEGMAAGDVVNTAARLQTAAPVNGVLVGETTYRATRDAIEYLEHEPVVAKGKSDPVAVWEAVQARSRLGMDLEQRAVLPLVGRTLEGIAGDGLRDGLDGFVLAGPCEFLLVLEFDEKAEVLIAIFGRKQLTFVAQEQATALGDSVQKRFDAGCDFFRGLVAAVKPPEAERRQAFTSGKLKTDFRVSGVHFFGHPGGLGLNLGRIAQLERAEGPVDCVAGHVAQRAGAEVLPAAPSEWLIHSAAPPSATAIS